ncbi:hypothetical protein X801_04859, partial [Opisthorchis viverrini]
MLAWFVEDANIFHEQCFTLLFFGEFNVDNTWHVNKTQTLSTGGAGSQ